MKDFTTVRNQSNVIFGKAPIFKEDTREMALRGYVTPIKLHMWVNYTKDGEQIKHETITDANKGERFVRNLMNIAEFHDKQIIKESHGRRRGFLFVSTAGNTYLKAVMFSSEFRTWANINNVGVYITSCVVNGQNKEYQGGGYIKKAGKDDFETQMVGGVPRPKQFKINEFINIINGKSGDELALTREETYTHMNIIINIDQLNTGVNLPGMNGYFLACYVNKNNPKAKQGPGRTIRPDKEDIKFVGNAENNAYMDNCPYVKPFSHIYVTPEQFDGSDLDDMKSVFNLYYQNYLMEKCSIVMNFLGTGEQKIINNEDRTEDDVKNNILLKKKYDGKDFCYDLILAGMKNTLEEMKRKIEEKSVTTPYIKGDKYMEYLTEEEKIKNEGDMTTEIGCAQVLKKLDEIKL